MVHITNEQKRQRGRRRRDASHRGKESFEPHSLLRPYLLVVLLALSPVNATIAKVIPGIPGDVQQLERHLDRAGGYYAYTSSSADTAPTTDDTAPTSSDPYGTEGGADSYQRERDDDDASGYSSSYSSGGHSYGDDSQNDDGGSSSSYSSGKSYGGYGGSGGSSSSGGGYKPPSAARDTITVPLFLALIVSFAMLCSGMLWTAHQLEHHPEGTYANCCRLSLSTFKCCGKLMYNIYHCRLGEIPTVICYNYDSDEDDFDEEELERMKPRKGIEKALDREHGKAMIRAEEEFGTKKGRKKKGVSAVGGVNGGK